MLYTNDEMYYMLVDGEGVPVEAMDIMLKIMGDTPQTYIKILNAISEYKTFAELDEAYIT